MGKKQAAEEEMYFKYEIQLIETVFCPLFPPLLHENKLP